LALSTTATRDAIEKPIRSAVGLKNVNLTEFGALKIPLPPLAEQYRIVAKLADLMDLCDQLETSLHQSHQARSHLLEATLHHALEPA
jgi:type I restriction enzyme S subunit